MEMLTGISEGDRISHFMMMQKPDINAQLAYQMDKRDVSLSPAFQEQVLRVHQWLAENEVGELPPSLERMYDIMIVAMLDRIDVEATVAYKKDERFDKDMHYRRQKILEFEDNALRFNNEFFDTEFLIECACDAYDLQYTKLDTDSFPKRRRIYKNPVQTFIMWGA